MEARSKREISQDLLRDKWSFLGKHEEEKQSDPIERWTSGQRDSKVLRWSDDSIQQRLPRTQMTKLMVSKWMGFLQGFEGHFGLQCLCFFLLMFMLLQWHDISQKLFS